MSTWRACWRRKCGHSSAHAPASPDCNATAFPSTHGYIDSCLFLPRRGKEETVRRLREDGHRVLAIGDAFNDLAMLRTADRGFLFRPSRQTLDAAKDLCVVRQYGEILKLLRQHGIPQWICEEIAK